MKRIISFILVAVMLIPLFAVMASAYTDDAIYFTINGVNVPVCDGQVVVCTSLADWANSNPNYSINLQCTPYGNGYKVIEYSDCPIEAIFAGMAGDMVEAAGFTDASDDIYIILHVGEYLQNYQAWFVGEGMYVYIDDISIGETIMVSDSLILDPSVPKNLSYGKSYDTEGYWIVDDPWPADYTADLTDGMACPVLTYDNNWFAFCTNAGGNGLNAPGGVGSVIIDLEDIYDISLIKVHTLMGDNIDGSGIYGPSKMSAYVSDTYDGDYTYLGDLESAITEDAAWMELSTDITGRYVMIEVTLNGLFAFINEVTVLGDDISSDEPSNPTDDQEDPDKPTNDQIVIDGDLTFMLSRDHYIVVDCDDYATSVVIPETVNGLPVKEIGDHAFYYCEYLTDVEIPDSVKTIGDSSFAFCETMTTVKFGSSLVTIGEWSFDCCRSLTSIDIPDSVEYVGIGAFNACTNIKDITIGKSVAYIGDSTFSACGLETISVAEENETYKSEGNCLIDTKSKTLILGCKNSIIPTDGSVVTIGYESFYNCQGLTGIVIPDSVKTIDYNAFSDCYNLETVDLGDSVEFIYAYAFGWCYSLKSFELPASIEYIDTYILAFCHNIENLTVAEGGEKFHSDGNCIIETETNTLVLGCKNSITPTDGSVTRIEMGAFYGCSYMTSIEIPDSVVFIDDHAFSWCSSLESITIPDSVTYIGGYTFYGCSSLKTIVIPKAVEYMGNYVFGECYDLTDIYCEAESQPKGWENPRYDSEFDMWYGGWNEDCDANVHWGYKDNSEPETQKGDINGNGGIDSMDYLYLKRAFFKQYTLPDISMGDINNNGEIDSMDYLYLKRAFFKQYVIQ